ncbi:cytochrome b [Parvibaculum sp.]|uniref:cytochrome b n=1 Tax=Parvibaculum sp. TaxID=2024848 RepID=UPI00271F868A|nr:cytochrome b [Parvibaculum sp.]MDO9125791.1 cytochrome b [Parvibaculum sp.]MDP1625750.1 cytochrome b [Parvibaculum sp.]MDP2149113.1 cytochrome b [Parvibaculum sp.]MDP3328348.1 cytochrome b [Parvibaculum sp.]
MKETASVNSGFATRMKSLHWAIAVLVLIMLYGGFTLSRETATLHFGTGLVVLVLMVIWLAVRRTSIRPAYTPMPRWQEIAAKATHHGLYASVTLQPVFGLLMVTTSKGEPVAYGVIPLKIVQNDTINEIGHVLHGVNGFLLTALVAVHILAALYHHFIVRDNVLKRMLPFAKA